MTRLWLCARAASSARHQQTASPARVPWRHALSMAVALLISGCAVGPDFKPPTAPTVPGYTAHDPSVTVAAPHVADGDAQHFVRDSEIPGDWWTLFHSRPLNALVEQALANNHDLKAAQAALSVARETMLAQRGAYAPSITAGASAGRQQQSTILAPMPNYPVVANEFLFNLFTPQVSVSYVPDVFGLNRRTVESLRAQEQAVGYQMIATQITLSANVVVAAVQEAALQGQIDATRDLVGINTKMLHILQYQFARGYAGKLDVAAQQAQLAQVAATLPPLLKQLAQQQHLLNVLTGRFPSQASAGTFKLSSLQLPQTLPLSLPSTLVAQRPDVLQAEANLHAASAQIGVAIANRLPSITLTADAGSTALAIGQVFKAGTGFWDLGAGITAPIFQGGKLRHQERAAKAAYVQAAEQYRSTVLTAFQNVADTLSALQQDAEGLQAAANAANAAKVTLDLSQRQWKDGYASYLSLLAAEQSLQQAQINLIQAQANRLADSAALFQALGGGWWQHAKPTQPTSGRNDHDK